MSITPAISDYNCTFHNFQKCNDFALWTETTKYNIVYKKYWMKTKRISSLTSTNSTHVYCIWIYPVSKSHQSYYLLSFWWNNVSNESICSENCRSTMLHHNRRRASELVMYNIYVDHMCNAKWISSNQFKVPKL